MSGKRGGSSTTNSPLNSWVLVVLSVFVIYGFLSLFQLGRSDLESDEGRFGLSALNILSDYHQLATVSEDPLGGPGTKPFMYPLLLAGSIKVLGKNEVAIRSVNVIVLAAAAWCLYLFVVGSMKDRELAALVFLLFLLNPGTISYARTAMPEPSVVLWGCAAVCGAARFYGGGRVGWGILCGIALAFGFLSKIWLILPFGLACFGIFLIAFIQNKCAKRIFVPLGAFIAFVLLSASHLLMISIWEPTELTYWLRMYFGTTLGNRVAGVGFDPAMWLRPWWFYCAAFFKASFFGMPIVLLGIVSLWKRRLGMIATVIGAMLFFVLLLSLFRVKEAAYMFPAFPAIALLMALGWKYFSKEATRKEIIISTLISMSLAAMFYMNAVYPSRDWLLIEILYVFYLAAGFLRHRETYLLRQTAIIATIASILFAGGVAVRKSLSHRTYYREIGRYFQPALNNERPQKVVFISPEFPAMEFYTFRSGQYWQTYLFHRNDADFDQDLMNGKLTFYVVDPSGQLYGGKASRIELAALQNRARQVTSEIEQSIGHEIPLRVFVPATARSASNFAPRSSVGQLVNAGAKSNRGRS